jgi:drug/metabolite transporter (DMT)-like permease
VNYLYIAVTILLTAYGQIVIKWQVVQFGSLPSGLLDKISFLVTLLLNPWIISAFVAAFLASVSWIGAMTKFELSHAYPFMSLNFVIVLLLSGLLFSEPISLQKGLGVLLICVGTAVATRG